MICIALAKVSPPRNIILSMVFRGKARQDSWGQDAAEWAVQWDLWQLQGNEQIGRPFRAPAWRGFASKKNCFKTISSITFW